MLGPTSCGRKPTVNGPKTGPGLVRDWVTVSLVHGYPLWSQGAYVGRPSDTGRRPPPRSPLNMSRTPTTCRKEVAMMAA